MKHSLTLILGGARSGKSTHALSLAQAYGGRVLYIATAAAGDEEMAERIATHKSERPPDWVTLEVQQEIGAAVRKLEAHYEAVILDCMTLLVSNLLFSVPEPLSESAVWERIDKELDGILEAVKSTRAAWLVVSNEVGLGLVPENKLGRLYRDLLGRANQRLAQAADEVILMVAGVPLTVKKQTGE